MRPNFPSPRIPRGPCFRKWWMRAKKWLPAVGLASAGIVLAQTTPAPTPKAGGVQQAPPPSPTIQSQTRLITVDVVVTDSHGAPVRGLEQRDFQVFEEHNREQEIAQFQFVDHAASAARPATPSPTVFTNELSSDLTVAPTILLMDALNTEITNQMQVRQHMLTLLKTLPPTTPVAVFSLEHTLHIMQNFSTDPKVLRAAIDKTLGSVPIEQNPQDDPQSASNLILDENGDQETQATQALEDFEAMTYEAQMAIRVDETTDAMIEISKYLGGFGGRKNLIWFSESFPIWLEPSGNFGTSPFNGSASYTDKVRAAAEALTDARVAVYPVDAQGLAIDQLYSASQNPHMNPRSPGMGLGGQLSRQNAQHLDQQATMDNLAESTGGRTCKNTNDLAGCVQSALNDDAIYYQLAYYPNGIAWDGQFHKITVKTTRRGVRLAYRRGYFATDVRALASRQKPEELLKQACRNPLPSTAITLRVEPIARRQTPGAAAQAVEKGYLLTVSPATLSFGPERGQRQLNLQMAICAFDQKTNSFQFFPRNLSRAVSDDLYQKWQQGGIQNIFGYNAAADEERLRFAVLDVPSGAVGSVDVPAHPHQFASIRGVPAASPSAAGPAQKTTQIITRLTFRAGNAASVLDWSHSSLSYHGDIGIPQGAPAFFQSVYGAKFHCQAGKLVSNDPASGATPSFLLTFRNPSGTGALVELGGEAPAYSGDLPVDASARAFFDYVWKLCHCQQP
jgi:VWFA-related protein